MSAIPVIVLRSVQVEPEDKAEGLAHRITLVITAYLVDARANAARAMGFKVEEAVRPYYTTHDGKRVYNKAEPGSDQEFDNLSDAQDYMDKLVEKRSAFNEGKETG